MSHEEQRALLLALLNGVDLCLEARCPGHMARDEQYLVVKLKGEKLAEYRLCEGAFVYEDT